LSSDIARPGRKARLSHASALADAHSLCDGIAGFVVLAHGALPVGLIAERHRQIGEKLIAVGIDERTANAYGFVDGIAGFAVLAHSALPRGKIIPQRGKVGLGAFGGGFRILAGTTK
jgi:hypothetical protein